MESSRSRKGLALSKVFLWCLILASLTAHTNANVGLLPADPILESVQGRLTDPDGNPTTSPPTSERILQTTPVPERNMPTRRVEEEDISTDLAKPKSQAEIESALDSISSQVGTESRVKRCRLAKLRHSRRYIELPLIDFTGHKPSRSRPARTEDEPSTPATRTGRKVSTRRPGNQTLSIYKIRAFCSFHQHVCSGGCFSRTVPIYNHPTGRTLFQKIGHCCQPVAFQLHYIKPISCLILNNPRLRFAGRILIPMVMPSKCRCRKTINTVLRG